MSEDTIEILLKYKDRFYEGTLHPQQVGRRATLPPESRAPVFPEPYSEMVSVIDEGNHWDVRPKRFLGTEDFAEIARIVKQYQGEYISAGKGSHFRVPKV